MRPKANQKNGSINKNGDQNIAPKRTLKEFDII